MKYILEIIVFNNLADFNNRFPFQQAEPAQGKKRNKHLLIFFINPLTTLYVPII